MQSGFRHLLMNRRFLFILILLPRNINGHLVISLTIFCGLFNSLWAQNKFTDNLNGMVNFHSGYSLPEYPFINAVTDDYVRSVDVSLFKETKGKSEWEQIYKYPAYGISLFYTTLGNDEVFGKELALTYFFRLYLYAKKRFRIYNRLGIGLSYVNRKFDLDENYLNVAVGSNFNIHFNARFGATYLLSDKLSLNSGLSFDHLSNGNTAEPNLGLNNLTFYTGVSYALGNQEEQQVHQLNDLEKESSMELFASIGGKHSRSLSSKYFFASSLSLELERAVSRVLRLGLGADVFYDSSVETSLEKDSRAYSPSDDFQTGIHLSQSIVYNKISFSIQQGIYIGLTEQVEDYLIYSRGIIKYQFNDHVAMRLAMKSHLHILDYPEIGIGLKL